MTSLKRCAGLDGEIRRLDEAVKLHTRATAEAREVMRGEVEHLRGRLAEARDLASHDRLTDLANRAEFDRRLKEVTLPERYVVAVIDSSRSTTTTGTARAIGCWSSSAGGWGKPSDGTGSLAALVETSSSCSRRILKRISSRAYERSKSR